MSTFDSTKTRLFDLLKAIKEGSIQLPDFQRGWVWDDEHIRSLLVSIARMFPVGAVMLLETGGPAKFKIRPVEGVDPSSVTPEMAESLILDGQQRLTSLTQVLKSDAAVKTRDAQKKEVQRFYYINIRKALEGPEHYEEAFIGVDADKCLKTNFGKDIVLDLRTPEQEYEAGYFPCNKIFDGDAWEEGYFSYHAANPERFGQYMTFRKDVLSKFRNYDVPVIELFKTNSKEAVCLVFEKVNTGGVPLSVFELITATYAADGVNLRDEWFGNEKDKLEGIRQYLHKQRILRTVEPTDFFQGLSLLHTYELRQADLAAGKTGKSVTGVSAKRETVLSLPLSVYQKWKEPLKEGFWHAARFLRAQSFFSTKELPYRTQLVPLAATLALLKDKWLEPEVQGKLSQWYWCGVLGELYGGAVETRFALDLQELLAWTAGGAELPTTVNDANFQSARLDSLRSRTSAAYKGISVLVQRGGAKDFFWQVAIKDLEESEWEESKLDIHHIFPRKWCESKNISPREFNSILNKTPISYKANRMIGGVAPSQYVLKIQNHAGFASKKPEEAPEVFEARKVKALDAILESHYISVQHLRADDYPGFIAQRREKLLSLIASVMGKSVGLESSGLDAADDEIDDFEDEEIL